MKIVALNYKDRCVEVYNVPKELEDFDDPDDVCCELGIDIYNSCYMFVNDDPDDVSVFYNNENIPAISL